MSKLIDRWFVKIGGSIYMLFFYSNLIYFTRWDGCHGHPIFLLEPSDRVELSSQDYKSCVITDILRRRYSINICIGYPDGNVNDC